MKKHLLALACAALICLPGTALATESGSLETLSNGGYAQGVTEEMTKASYWSALTTVKTDALLATADEIDVTNQSIIAGSGTGVSDLTESYKVLAVSADAIPTKNLYLDGVQIDKATYFGKLQDAIADTQWGDTAIDATGVCKGDERPFAICTTRTNLKSWPTNDFLGYSATDEDDELQSDAVLVNEPLRVKQRCEVDGHVFYLVNTTDLAGWVDGDCIALCSDKQQWLDAWQVDTASDDFVVVTQSKLFTETNKQIPSISKVELHLGTILKLVADEDLAEGETIGGRGTWHNYVVWLPTRNEDGTYQARKALIPETYSLSEGFLPYTQDNVIKVSLSCLGDRYGWGGCLDAMDCSLYTRSVYRCFGYELPRNTAKQPKTPGKAIDLMGLGDAEKQALIETLPAGTMLYFSGHTMIYLGSIDGVGYVVSDLGSVYETAVVEGETARTIYTVALNPLTVRRGSSTTSGDTTSRRWLTHLTSAVVLANPVAAGDSGLSIALSKDSATYTGKSQKPTVSVKAASGATVDASRYQVAWTGDCTAAGTNTVKVTFDDAGIVGSLSKTFVVKQASQSITGVTTSKTLSAKKLAKKALSFTLKAKAQGTVTYKKVSGSAKVTVTSAGKVTVKKKTKKGTYKVKVKVMAAATANYQAATVTKTIKVKVK